MCRFILHQWFKYKITLQGTPPYSLFNHINYNIATRKKGIILLSTTNVKFDAQWFTKITGKLVLMSQARFGYLGQYNSKVGPSPFERFKLGGDGMQSYQFLQGTDIIGMSGYENFSSTGRVKLQCKYQPG
jgi:outer membrane protein insertion porin family